MASSQATYLPPLTEEDRALFMNKKVVDKLPAVLSIIVSWNRQKSSNQSFEEYLKNDRKVSNTKLKKNFNKDDLKKLKQTTFAGFDLTFMCQLLPLLCDGIADVGTPEWKSNDEAKVETHLNKLREIRNAVMHEPEGAAVDHTLIDKVHVIADKLLETAAAKYSIGATDVQKAKHEVKKIMWAIRDVVMTEKEQISIHLQRLILKDGIRELRDKLELYKENTFPLPQHMKGFYSIQLIDKDAIIIPCKDLLKYCNRSSSKRIFIIQGQIGSGKSTLLKEIQKDIVRKKGEKRIFEDSAALHIPLFFSCGTASIRSLAQLISQEFPCLSTKSKEGDFIIDIIGQMKCLFLVDGLDEISDHSKITVDEILALMKNNNNAVCLFTSRLHSVALFQSKFDEAGFSFSTLKMKELESKEEQMNFLLATCETSKAISEDYETSNLNLKTPVHLGLYSLFHSHDSGSVKSGTNLASLMRGAIDYGLKNAAKRLHRAGIKDCQLRSQGVLEKIAYLSFCCLLQDKLVLGKPETKWLTTETRQEFIGSGSINALEVISCFLPAVDTESFNRNAEDFNFYSKTHQEVYGAIYIHQKIVETHASIEEICIRAMQKYDSIGKTEEEIKAEEMKAEKKKVLRKARRQLRFAGKKIGLNVRTEDLAREDGQEKETIFCYRSCIGRCVTIK